MNEIVFINTLEAQNRKMELLSKEQVAESKRLELQVRQQVCYMTSFADLWRHLWECAVLHGILDML